MAILNLMKNDKHEKLAINKNHVQYFVEKYKTF